MFSLGSSQIKWVALSALSILSGSCSRRPNNGNDKITLFMSGIVEDEEEYASPSGYPLQDFLQFCKAERSNKQRKLYHKCSEFIRRLRADVKPVKITSDNGYFYRNSGSCKLLDADENTCEAYFVGYFPENDELLLIEERFWKGACTEKKNYGYDSYLPKKYVQGLQKADEMLEEYNIDGTQKSTVAEKNDKWKSRITMDDLRIKKEEREANERLRRENEIQKLAQEAKVAKEQEEARKRLEARIRQEEMKHQEELNLQAAKDLQKEKSPTKKCVKGQTRRRKKLENTHVTTKDTYTLSEWVKKCRNESSKKNVSRSTTSELDI